MKLSFKVFLISCLCLIFTQSDAQFLKKLGEKVSKKVEKTVERKTEQKAEKTAESAMDSLFEGNKNKEKAPGYSKDDENRANAMLEAMMGGEDVEVADSYSFPVIATMEIESYKRNKSDEIQHMKQGYGKSAMYMVMENNPENPIITDMENEAMIMLDDKKNVAQVMSLAWMKKMGQYDDHEAPDENNMQVTKTGNRKTIAGYSCEEYIFTNDDNKVHAWFTPDVAFDYTDYLSGFSNLFGKKKGDNPMTTLTETYGYVMEMMAYNKKGEKETRMTVTDISEEGRTINMSKYSVQNMLGQSGK